ncbi:MAG: sensor histidine kinase [Cecembia sp.]
MKPQHKITFIYFLVGAFWILLSDLAIEWLFEIGKIEKLTYHQSIKGLVYVALTALMLYFLIRHYYNQLNVRLKELEELNRILSVKSSELETSNKDLEQFAYVASHDLQEPLRMISGFMKLLEKYKDKIMDEKASQYIRFANEGAEKMRGVILNLLAYAKAGKEAYQMEEFYVQKVLDDIWQVQQKNHENVEASLIFEYLPLIKSYKVPFTMIIQNLVSNALKYKIPDKKVIIQFSAEELEEEWLFKLNDNGIGIAKEDYESIFQPFLRLRNDDIVSGSGMGLAIVKKNVELMGGKVWLESVVGKGSTFFFTVKKVPVN